MRRTGIGRRTLLHDDAGDPLEGLVNLFDLGIVLALAFLVAGLTVAFSRQARREHVLPAGTRALPSNPGGRHASGTGEAVGRVYKLADGRLVYVPSGAVASRP